jgi:hypothetical protein
MPCSSPLTHGHFTNPPVRTNVPITHTHHHVQMSPTTLYDALVHILGVMGAPEDQIERLAINAICPDEDDTLSDEETRFIQKALQRLPLMYPQLSEGNVQQATRAAEGTATTVSRQQANTAILGKEGARFTILYPLRFDPEKSTGSCGNHK